MIAQVDDIIQEQSPSESKLQEFEDSQPKIELTESPFAVFEDENGKHEIIDISKNLRSQLSEVKEAQKSILEQDNTQEESQFQVKNLGNIDQNERFVLIQTNCIDEEESIMVSDP